MRSSKPGCNPTATSLSRSSPDPMEDGIKDRDSVTSLPDEAGENIGEIRRAVEVLFEPGVVAELRAFKEGKTTSGYFDDFEKLAEQAAKLDGRGFAVYATLNPVEPALLARATNRVRPVYREPTTSDADVACRRWLPVDFDPVRPAGVSATDREKGEARQRAMEVRSYLRGKGWPEPVVSDSGNGYHLLYRVDLPNDRESLELVKGVLEALSFRFSDERVSVDTTTANAARIWKLYGTTARKGDATEGRPHRASGMLKVPGEVDACRP
jgi:hypothetical protein